jgi:ribose/xylose/arabinose/galactoside ABC-type transport system permease subunit
MKGLYSAFGGYMPGGFPFFGLPSVTWPFLIVVLLTYGFLRWAPLGRRAYAIGGNEAAAYLSGIPVKRTKIYLYTLMGALVGITGMVLSGQINEASFNLAQNFELQSIACAVIGGTALFGGRGGAFRSLQGVALWGLVQNSILFIGFSSNYQQMSLGVIIIIAVMVTRVQR